MTTMRFLGATRILAGILFAGQGAQKLLLAAFGGLPPGAPAGIVWTAGLIELALGVLVAWPSAGWLRRLDTGVPGPAVQGTGTQGSH
jgi:hypothetical protein